jgi:kelch-like protein 2/3
VVLLLSLDLPMEHALLYYDPNNNILKNAPPMSKRFMHDVYPCALVLLKEHFLFAVGNIFTSKSVLMLDLSLQSPCWIPIVNMLVNRTNIGVGVIDDKIYAVSYTNVLLILYYKNIYYIKC